MPFGLTSVGQEVFHRAQRCTLSVWAVVWETGGSRQSYKVKYLRLAPALQVSVIIPPEAFGLRWTGMGVRLDACHLSRVGGGSRTGKCLLFCCVTGGPRKQDKLLLFAEWGWQLQPPAACVAAGLRITKSVKSQIYDPFPSSLLFTRHIKNNCFSYPVMLPHFIYRIIHKVAFKCMLK